MKMFSKIIPSFYVFYDLMLYKYVIFILSYYITESENSENKNNLIKMDNLFSFLPGNHFTCLRNSKRACSETKSVIKNYKKSKMCITKLIMLCFLTF